MVTKSKKRSKASKRDNTTAKKPLTPTPAQPTSGNGSAPSNLDMLRRMYAAMLKCRMMEERARDGNAVVAYDLATGHEAVAMLKCRMMEERARDGNAVVAYDLATGQEAVVIGASIDLKPE